MTLTKENLSHVLERSMLADYQQSICTIDRRIRTAERATQAEWGDHGRDGSGRKVVDGGVEALDQFMAAMTDEKVLANSHDENGSVVSDSRITCS